MYLTGMTTKRESLSQQGNSLIHFHKQFNQYTLRLVGHPLDICLVLFSAVSSLQFPHASVDTNYRHFSGDRKILCNVAIDILNNNKTGTCDFFGWFKESREEEKWREEENNGRGKLK